MIARAHSCIVAAGSALALAVAFLVPTAGAQSADSHATSDSRMAMLSETSAMPMGHPENLMAMLTAPNGASTPTGMAMVSGTAVQLSLSGDAAGSTRLWHIHQGTCKDDKGIVGAAEIFPVVRIADKGIGQAKATLASPLAEHAPFFVAVHASATDMKTVIACGDLKPTKM